MNHSLTSRNSALHAKLLGGLLLPFAASATSFNTDFYATVRAGIGSTTQGDTSQCFRLEGATAKYRLGNECEQVHELALRSKLAELSDGSSITMVGMAILYSPYGEKMTFRSKDNGYTRLAQGYFSWDKLPWLNGGSVWAGRRYYRRNDIFINDFHYWSPIGTGAGIEEVGIAGPVSFSYFFSRRDSVFQDYYVNRHDLQFSHIQTNHDGALEFGLSYIEKSDSHPGSHSGWSITAQHRQSNILGDKNVFAIQYGKGPGTGLGYTGDIFLDRNHTRLRILDGLSWQSGRFGGQVAAVWQRDTFANAPSQVWWTVGARPVYAFTGQFKLHLEVSHDRVNPSSGRSRNLNRISIAPSWSPRGTGFWTRPEFRLHFAWAKWNRGAQEAADLFNPGSAMSSTGSFGPAFHGGNFGFSIEYF